MIEWFVSSRVFHFIDTLQTWPEMLTSFFQCLPSTSLMAALMPEITSPCRSSWSSQQVRLILLSCVFLLTNWSWLVTCFRCVELHRGNANGVGNLPSPEEGHQGQVRSRRLQRWWWGRLCSQHFKQRRRLTKNPSTILQGRILWFFVCV